MESLISIIVPVYNVEAYLSKCLDSILAQTYSNLEIILVDDGATDSSSRICDEYAEKDCRIKVLHKENGGVSSARNAGLKICAGEYLMFVDADDYISEDAVQVLYERMRSDGSDMIVGKHTDVYEDGTTNGAFCSWMKDAVLSNKEVFAKLGERNYIAVVSWGKMYRRTIFDGILYPALTCGEDLWNYPLIVDNCKTISVVDQTLYFYFQRSNSILHEKSEQSKRDDLNAVLHLVQFLWLRNFEKSALRWYAIAIDKALSLKNKREGLSIFKEYFPPVERRKLLKGQRSKAKMKWRFLYVPFLYDMIKGARKLMGGK